MQLINRFSLDDDEEEYAKSERQLRRNTTRSLLIIGMFSFLGFFIATPVFSSNESFAAFNVSTVGVAGGFAFAFYLIGTRYYIDWPWIDCSVFALATIACGYIFSTLVKLDAVDGISLLIISTMIFAGNIFIASIAFVANLRYFSLCLVAQTIIYFLFIKGIDAPSIIKSYASVFVALFLILSLFSNWEFDRRSRNIFEGKKLLKAEQEKTEALLYNVLPQTVAKRLRAGAVVADSFSDISVIFVDIVGFSKIAKELTPLHLVEQLNRFFSIADECADRLGIEKVKTIGDAYLAVAGGTASGGYGAKDAIQFGIELIAHMERVAQLTKLDVKLRVGIHSGPVVGGVVGSSRLAYDYWGDTMNIASRIEGAAEPNGIAISTATYHQCSDCYQFGPPEIVNLKGVGATQIYRLIQEPT